MQASHNSTSAMIPPGFISLKVLNVLFVNLHNFPQLPSGQRRITCDNLDEQPRPATGRLLSQISSLNPKKSNKRVVLNFCLLPSPLRNRMSLIMLISFKGSRAGKAHHHFCGCSSGVQHTAPAVTGWHGGGQVVVPGGVVYGLERAY